MKILASCLLLAVAISCCVILLITLFSTTPALAAPGDDNENIIPGEQDSSERPQFTNIRVKHPDHDEEPASEDADSSLGDHEAMRCHVCRHAVKPALIKAIKTQAGSVDSKELVDEVLRSLAHKHIYDLESKSIILRDIPEESHYSDAERDENIHQFIEHLLWDEHLACQLYGLADVYVQQPRRRHWFARLVDHTICPCHNGKEVFRLDDGIDKYLMNHIAATTEAMKRYKMGHEIFDDENIDPQLNRQEEKEEVREEDRHKADGATHLGQIWVDGDGHLDERTQEQHSHDQDGMQNAQMHSNNGDDGF